MESNQSNAAAVRAFRVLEEVARHRDGCALAAVVEAVGLPKQTVHRLVGQLQLAGLVVREPGTRRARSTVPGSRSLREIPCGIRYFSPSCGEARRGGLR